MHCNALPKKPLRNKWRASTARLAQLGIYTHLRFQPPRLGQLPPLFRRHLPDAAALSAVCGGEEDCIRRGRWSKGAADTVDCVRLELWTVCETCRFVEFKTREGRKSSLKHTRILSNKFPRLQRDQGRRSSKECLGRRVELRGVEGNVTIHERRVLSPERLRILRELSLNIA